MQITANTVVSLSYTLTNQQGDVLDQADQESPFMYLHGANNIITGLEKALENKQADDSLQVVIEPQDAYGERDETLTQQIPRSMFEGIGDEQLVPGAKFHAQTNYGIETIMVKAVDGDHITIDANHPLAGEILHFDVTILAVRAASEEELSHGHVHPDGECGEA